MFFTVLFSIVGALIAALLIHYKMPILGICIIIVTVDLLFTKILILVSKKAREYDVVTLVMVVLAALLLIWLAINFKISSNLVKLFTEF